MKLALCVALALISGCSCSRRAPSPSVDEVARLKSEQSDLKARIAALEQRLAAPSPVAAPSPPLPPDTTAVPAPAAAPPTSPSAVAPSVPAPPPAPSAVVPKLPSAPVPSLPVEDLHGLPAAASPGDPTAALAGLQGAQAEALVKQLHQQLEALKAKQTEQQSVLDELDKMR